MKDEGNNRKTSPKLQEQVNPGPKQDAKAYETGPTPAAPAHTVPKGRGTTESDHSQTEKQNQ